MKNTDLIYICMDCGSALDRMQRNDGYVHPCTNCNSKNLYKTTISLPEYNKMRRHGKWDDYVASLFPDKSEVWKSTLKSAHIQQKEIHKPYIQSNEAIKNIPKQVYHDDVFSLTKAKMIIFLLAV